MDFRNYWNESHTKYSIDKIIYDNWLDKYLDYINECKTPILDLGCGLGNDTLYLKEKGFDVIACDFSEVALNQVRSKISDVKTINMDITKRLDFNDESFDVIVADLSLHYFDDKTTQEIMYEIKRVLTSEGILLARVNSVEDTNYGAGTGEKIENNFYYVDGYNKRFFDLIDAQKYFSIIGEVKVTKEDMLRYSKPKKVIEVFVRK